MSGYVCMCVYIYIYSVSGYVCMCVCACVCLSSEGEGVRIQASAGGVHKEGPVCVFMCVCARVFARPRSPTLQSLGKAGKTLDVEQWCFPICHAPQHHHPTKPLCTCMCMLAE